MLLCFSKRRVLPSIQIAGTRTRSELKKADFDHFKVNHYYDFVDLDIDVHIQAVERMWSTAN